MSKFIEGTGRLHIGGKDQGTCSYHLAVFGDDALKIARGKLNTDPAAAMEAFNADGGVTVVRDDTGFEMPVIVTEISGDKLGVVLPQLPG